MEEVVVDDCEEPCNQPSSQETSQDADSYADSHAGFVVLLILSPLQQLYISVKMC